MSCWVNTGERKPVCPYCQIDLREWMESLKIEINSKERYDFDDFDNPNLNVINSNASNLSGLMFTTAANALFGSLSNPIQVLSATDLLEPDSIGHMMRILLENASGVSGNYQEDGIILPRFNYFESSRTSVTEPRRSSGDEQIIARGLRIHERIGEMRALIPQVMGRAIRRDSHDQLSLDVQNPSVYHPNIVSMEQSGIPRFPNQAEPIVENVWGLSTIRPRQEIADFGPPSSSEPRFNIAFLEGFRAIVDLMPDESILGNTLKVFPRFLPPGQECTCPRCTRTRYRGDLDFDYDFDIDRDMERERMYNPDLVRYERRFPSPFRSDRVFFRTSIVERDSPQTIYHTSEETRVIRKRSRRNFRYQNLTRQKREKRSKNFYHRHQPRMNKQKYNRKR
jgi:hypothetical protein